MVVVVNVTDTVVPVVFCCAKDNGGVHEIEVAVESVAIVPDALPQVYVTVSVNDEFCFVIVIVCDVPSVPLDADILEPAADTGN